MELEYNTQRNKLIIAEYGRHIQKMVEYTIELPSKRDRQKMANSRYYSGTVVAVGKELGHSLSK